MPIDELIADEKTLVCGLFESRSDQASHALGMGGAAGQTADVSVNSRQYSGDTLARPSSTAILTKVSVMANKASAGRRGRGWCAVGFIKSLQDTAVRGLFESRPDRGSHALGMGGVAGRRGRGEVCRWMY